MEQQENLPYFVEGPVVKGFGRGSKELGIPTANFPEDVVRKIPESLPCGVYYGWACVDSGPVLPMVMSVGWNPYYHNTVKTMETHILHDFKQDFYGSILKVILIGYIRPMEDYSSLDALIEAINSDIAIAKKELQSPEMLAFQSNNFFLGDLQNSSATIIDKREVIHNRLQDFQKKNNNNKRFEVFDWASVLNRVFALALSLADDMKKGGHPHVHDR
ncbi:hypothetical protein BaRGS_00018810 [Batillaria attramentaria]|uniref:Riboflavin kinase n=1 Tax=Batillaria attramentaria TaxID=370345 RepID=A0ABD0KRN7_9CAEN